jgi:nitrile hydratase accessory protein
MAAETNPEIANMDGDSALPRSNGELVFEAPWEGRAFGIAVALNEQAVYPWRSFRDALVDQIADDEAVARNTTYYERWLASLEALLLQQGLVTKDELDVRTAEYASGERDDDWDPDHHTHHDHEGHSH